MAKTATSTSAAMIERYTMAWYWEGLGLGRLAGLHLRHTDWPHGTVIPHRTHRSYSPRISVSTLRSPRRPGNPSGEAGRRP